jgi:adenylylsulfate kinase-like enzyme
MTGPIDSAAGSDSCVVFMLGYPATGKRTVGGHLATMLHGALIDNALINRPVLEVLQWDGVRPLPTGVWEYVAPIRETVLHAIEELAPPSTSYVFTNVLEDGPGAAEAYEVVRSLAARRGSLFLAVMLTCDLDEQVRRIDTPDRIALRKGADPEGYRGYTLAVDLFQPPEEEVLHLDTTRDSPADNARRILEELRRRGLQDDAERRGRPGHSDG